MTDRFTAGFTMLILLGVSIVSAVPFFMVKGAVIAVLCTIAFFFTLCFLRDKVMKWHSYPSEEGPRISHSFQGLAELNSVIFPSIFLAGASFGVAYLMWGWKFTV